MKLLISVLCLFCISCVTVKSETKDIYADYVTQNDQLELPECYASNPDLDKCIPMEYR